MDERETTRKEGVTLLLLCVGNAVQAGLERWPLDPKELEERAVLAPMKGYSSDAFLDPIPRAAIRVSCPTCGAQHRLVLIESVAAKGGLAFVGEDCAVLLKMHVDESGLTGAAAVERAERVRQRSEDASRNDPCSCGSGKKARKCCSRPQ